jgi:predicted DsbA family dithiol-disulfide isomerase
MKVEIWSDVVCPYCYIGKRKFEQALSEFDGKNNVEIVWRSFQLDPALKPKPGQTAIEYLASSKGQSLEWSKQAHANVTGMAKQVGLDYHFELTKVANTYHAHRLLKHAQRKGLGGAMKERLLKAYFEEGADLGNFEELADLAASIGLDKQDALNVLAGDGYGEAVEDDAIIAQTMDVYGVPFFLIDGRFGITGVHEPKFFLKALQRAAEASGEEEGEDEGEED